MQGKAGLTPTDSKHSVAQRTDMGKGRDSFSCKEGRCFTWAEVKRHAGLDDKYLVIDGGVYDVSQFQRSHPGGAKIISHFAGQDATEVWRAYHKNKEYVEKFLKPLRIGLVKGKTRTQIMRGDIQADFEDLRKMAEQWGWFQSDPVFFGLHLCHFIILELISCWVLHFCGATWPYYLLALTLLIISQAQAGWSMHDYGHNTVFKTTKSNRQMQLFILGFWKASSAQWWNFRHNQHHAKTNVFRKDPDVTLPFLFLLGDKMPVWWGKAKKGTMPYHWQNIYYWIFGPLSLLPVYFHCEILYFVLKRRNWVDLLLIIGFGVRWVLLFGGALGWGGAFALYMLVRVGESVWFTMVTQMSHIPMDIDQDQEYDWVTSNTITTTNVTEGAFTDWFTGHLNYQIEHHLFPTMPRHNFHKVAPLVKSLCKKHHITYTEKTLCQAFADIPISLKRSGQLWHDHYYGIVASH